MRIENSKTLVRSTRTAYADALLDLGPENDRLVVLDADLSGRGPLDGVKFPQEFQPLFPAVRQGFDDGHGLSPCLPLKIRSCPMDHRGRIRSTPVMPPPRLRVSKTRSQSSSLPGWVTRGFRSRGYSSRI